MACLPLCFSALLFFSDALSTQTTTRLSVDSFGAQANGASGGSLYLGTPISADGRFVAFDSTASNLVLGDTNATRDVFVRDVVSGLTTRVSLSSTGAEGNGISIVSGISADGSIVLFSSWADNLVSGDTNGAHDVFVHDRISGQTTRVSVNSSGLQANANSSSPALSADGRFVAFGSDATNLVAGDTNGADDVFVHDRTTGKTRCVSVDAQGVPASGDSSWPNISGDGRFVSFESEAADLIVGDVNSNVDVFVRDMLLGATTIASLHTLGSQGNGASALSDISAAGTHVAFTSTASNLVSGDTNGVYDIFVRDLAAGQTTRVSVRSGGAQANQGSDHSSISASGRYIGFVSLAGNLGCGSNGDYSVFVHDRMNGTTECISVDRLGFGAKGREPSVSADGRYVAFLSSAENLVSGDTNGVEDIFLRDRGWTGPALSRTGTCPGVISLDVISASPGQPVLFVSGRISSYVHGGPTCAGLTLVIAPPTLRTMRVADGSGAIHFQFNAPPSACGVAVQAVDVATCVATNVVVL